MFGPWSEIMVLRSARSSKPAPRRIAASPHRRHCSREGLQQVAVVGNLITSRKPDDVPAFSEALINALQEERISEPA